MYCFCIYLFVFGGDFFVVLNFIDFDKVFVVFGNLVEMGNFVVLLIVCVIFGLYVLVFVLVRREDKWDELRVSVFVIDIVFLLVIVYFNKLCDKWLFDFLRIYLYNCFG